MVALGVVANPSVPTSAPAGRPGDGLAVRLTAASTCADLMIVSVDPHGSGWGGAESLVGPTKIVAAGLATRARAAGQSVVGRHLGVPSPGVGELVGDAPRGQHAASAVTRQRVRTWLRPVAPAVDRVAAQLRSAAAACPEQTFALVGTAQGADIVHRLLLRLPTSSLATVLRDRVVGAALVSDGDRTSATRATLDGHPAAARTGRGAVTRVLGAKGDVPTSALPVQVSTVCTTGDVVCDLRGLSVRRSLAAYHVTGTAAGRKSLNSAAAQVALRAAAWPTPATGQPVAAITGAPISTRLRPQVATPFAAGVVFDTVSGLPTGVTLDAHGLISGTPTSAGSFHVTYRVHGTTPETSSRSGSLVLTVTDPVTVTPVVSAGGLDSCFVRADGAAFCAGSNQFGQLGDGTTSSRSTQTQVGGGAVWSSISTSGATTCGIQTTGSLWCWGTDYRGELGLGGGPVRYNPQRVGTSNAWAQVSTGWMHTCAVRTNGTLWCWGGDERGQLGLGAVGGDKQTPTRVGPDSDWTSVSVGGWSTCALRRDHSAWCWGRNDVGQLGIGSLAQRSTPTRISSQPGWAAISANWSSTCALTLAGAAYCWGIDDEGQLGDGTRTLRIDPTAVQGDHVFTSISTGDQVACGIDTDAAAWCWGSNRYGELGSGSSEALSSTPVRVAGDSDRASVDVGWMHACVLRTSGGGLQCWGDNEQGQLARGNRDDKSTPPGSAAGAGASARVATARQAQRADSHLVVTTFNVLGSQHTAPGGGAPHYAPGRVRAEWAANLLQSYDSDIVGFQEMQADQAADLERSLGGTYAFYSGSASSSRAVNQTIMWKRSEWTFQQAITVDIPFKGQLRPNPMVRLRNTASGKDVWVLNLHNSANSTAARRAERMKALKIEAGYVDRADANGVPTILLGDLNDHRTAYCYLTGHTKLEAAQGGTHSGGTCTPPKQMRVDWIFASPAMTPLGYRFEQTGRVARTTDHSVLTATFTLPGA